MKLKNLFNIRCDSKNEYSWKDIQEAQRTGFEECKRKVLEILKKDWTGADLSINSCDEYYIEKIKDLK